MRYTSRTTLMTQIAADITAALGIASGRIFRNAPVLPQVAGGLPFAVITLTEAPGSREGAGLRLVEVAYTFDITVVYAHESITAGTRQEDFKWDRADTLAARLTLTAPTYTSIGRLATITNVNTEDLPELAEEDVTSFTLTYMVTVLEDQ